MKTDSQGESRSNEGAASGSEHGTSLHLGISGWQLRKMREESGYSRAEFIRFMEQRRSRGGVFAASRNSVVRRELAARVEPWFMKLFEEFVGDEALYRELLTWVRREYPNPDGAPRRAPEARESSRRENDRAGDSDPVTEPALTRPTTARARVREARGGEARGGEVRGRQSMRQEKEPTSQHRDTTKGRAAARASAIEETE